MIALKKITISQDHVEQITQTCFDCNTELTDFSSKVLSLLMLYNKGPSNKFIFRATYGNSIVYNIFPE
jgi:hypothetical protein